MRTLSLVRLAVSSLVPMLLNTDYLFVAVVSNVHEIFEKIAYGSEASEAVNGSRSNGT